MDPIVKRAASIPDSLHGWEKEMLKVVRFIRKQFTLTKRSQNKGTVLFTQNQKHYERIVFFPPLSKTDVVYPPPYNETAIDYLIQQKVLNKPRQQLLYIRLNCPISDPFLLDEKEFKALQTLTPEKTKGFIGIYFPITSFTIKDIDTFLGISETKKITIIPLLEKDPFQVLPDGTFQISINNDWITFCKLDLQLSKGLISSCAGQVLFWLIKRKIEVPDAFEFSIDSINEEIPEFSSKQIYNSIDTIRDGVPSDIKRSAFPHRNQKKIKEYPIYKHRTKPRESRGNKTRI